MKSRCMIAKFDYGVCRRRKGGRLRKVKERAKSANIHSRIGSANILLITMKSLANEVAKNLVLAGIGSLTIIDHEPVTSEDLQSQFFLEAAIQDPEIVNQGINVFSFD